MANFGKYTTSLVVVMIGATQGSKSVAKVIVAALATIYSATWDIKMDFSVSWETVTGRADGKHKRMFRPHTYIAACLADVVLRSVWVMSLFPVSAFVGGIVNRLMFRAVISALELLRRSIWFILRVEHEQDALDVINQKRDEGSFMFRMQRSRTLDDQMVDRAMRRQMLRRPSVI